MEHPLTTLTGAESNLGSCLNPCSNGTPSDLSGAEIVVAVSKES